MRSYELRQDAKSNAWCLYKKRRGQHYMKAKAEIGVMHLPPKHTKDFWQHQELEERHWADSLRASRRNNQCLDFIILASRTVREYIFIVLICPDFSSLFWQPQETNIPSHLNFLHCKMGVRILTLWEFWQELNEPESKWEDIYQLYSGLWIFANFNINFLGLWSIFNSYWA